MAVFVIHRLLLPIKPLRGTYVHRSRRPSSTAPTGGSGSLIGSSRRRNMFLILVVILLIAAMSLFFFKIVKVKMLPFDNKSEFQIVIDMPEGTPLEKTYQVARELADYIRTVPEATNYQLYIGTSAPVNSMGWCATTISISAHHVTFR
jgi:multidrug efflux pump subunit AcrB